MSDALRRRGFDAVELHSAEECLDSLRRLGAAVVVTDVQMPGMSGLQLTCELSSTYPQVRTVIVTGLATAALTAEARQLGAFEVVSKPVRIDDLAKIVRRALESSD